jgi:hypothetical protein
LSERTRKSLKLVFSRNEWQRRLSRNLSSDILVESFEAVEARSDGSTALCKLKQTGKRRFNAQDSVLNL